MNNLIRVLSILYLITILLACEGTTEPTPPEETLPYHTLNLGDIRQYYIERSDTYLTDLIVDTVRRADGQKVFVMEETHVIPNFIFKGKLNLFIEDGYLWRTELETVGDLNSNNPFNQEKIALIHPIDNMVFSVNTNTTDSIRLFMKCELIDSVQTNMQSFYNIARYKQFSQVDLDTNTITYFAEKFGHIGAKLIQGIDTSNIFISYLKIDGVELGSYVNLIDNTKDINIKPLRNFLLFNK